MNGSAHVDPFHRTAVRKFAASCRIGQPSTEFDEKENWPELVALTSVPLVELPGIEPELLPGIMRSELRFRDVSFPFVPVHSRSLPAVSVSGLDGVKNVTPVQSHS
jgi:hypothetical protein